MVFLNLGTAEDSIDRELHSHACIATGRNPTFFLKNEHKRTQALLGTVMQARVPAACARIGVGLTASANAEFEQRARRRARATTAAAVRLRASVRIDRRHCRAEVDGG